MQKRDNNIRKRKDGRYEGRYADGYKTDGTIRYRSVYGKNHTEVKQKLYAAGGKSESSKISSKILFEEFCEIWLQSKKLLVKASTSSHYKTVVEKHLYRHFAGQRISQITEQSVQAFAEFLIKDHKVKTVKDILIILGQILSFANELGLCRPVKTDVKLPKEPKGRIEVFTQAQYRRLLLYLKNHLDLQHLGVLICMQTGARLGEICGLRFGDIDFESGTISIKRTIQRISNENGGTMFLIDTPKTENSIREIPISGSLMKYLEPYRGHRETAYFLTGTEDFIQPRTYQNRFKQYLKECGLPETKFHTLRHTFASRAVELGFDVKSLSEILGHASVNITLDRYVHSSLEQKRKQMELFSAM